MELVYVRTLLMSYCDNRLGGQQTYYISLYQYLAVVLFYHNTFASKLSLFRWINMQS